MSEYYFKYMCRSMSSKIGEENDNAFTFFLKQDYSRINPKNINDNFDVCIHIPKEVKADYYGANLYVLPGGVEFSKDFKNKVKPVFWNRREEDCEQGGFAISKDNSIVISGTSNDLSCVGIISFIKTKEDLLHGKIDESDEYRFAINFAKKELISYRIIEKKQSILVQVLYPFIRQDIELNIIKKAKAKPVLMKDRTKLDAGIGDDTIVLKARGRKVDSVKKKIFAPSIGTDFRLMFKDEFLNNYYILSDESDSTIEENKSNKIQLNNLLKNNDDNIKRCPYCGQNMGITNLKNFKDGRTHVITCQGKELFINDINSEYYNKITLVCEINRDDTKELIEKDPDFDNYIPISSKYWILPDDIIDRPTMNIVVAGARCSGKSILLSSLYYMHKTGESMDSRPDVFNRILAYFGKNYKYGKKFAKLLPIKSFNLLVDPSEKLIESDEIEKLRDKGVKSLYSIGTGETIGSNTSADLLNILSWHPMGYEMGENGYAYLYDLPGEVFRKDSDKTTRTMNIADGIIAVIDGEDNKNALANLKDAFERLPNLREKDLINTTAKDLKKIPIAVVFTKLDKKMENYAENKDNCFDENCHVVREDVLSFFPKNGRYLGSALERHIDVSSYELEHYLKSLGDDAIKTIEEIKANYNFVKFFAVSALGSNYCLDVDKTHDAVKVVRFAPNCLRLELPFVWLMYVNGLIKRW